MPTKFSLSAADLALALTRLISDGISATEVAADYGSATSGNLTGSVADALAYKAVAVTLLIATAPNAHDYDSLATEAEFYVNSLALNPLATDSGAVSIAKTTLASPYPLPPEDNATALATLALALSGATREGIAKGYRAKGGSASFTPLAALAYKAVACAALALLGNFSAADLAALATTASGYVYENAATFAPSY